MPAEIAAGLQVQRGVAPQMPPKRSNVMKRAEGGVMPKGGKCASGQGMREQGALFREPRQGGPGQEALARKSR